MTKSPSPSNEKPGMLARVAPPALSLLGFVALWQGAVSVLRLKPYLLPGPATVVSVAIEHRERLVGATAFTLKVSLIAFAVVLALGTIAAIALASSEVATRAFYPYAVMLQSTPVIAIAPLIIIWFGLGAPSIIAISFIIAVFSVIANTTAGLRSVDQPLRDVFTLYQASRWQTIRKLTLPFALPSMLTGWKIAAAQVVVGAIVGEYMAGAGGGSEGGLGLIIAESSARLETPYLFAAAFLSAFLGITIFAVVSAIEYFALRSWHPSFQK
jgi:NitT/TauT family transport system permease protein